jgi:hypothetical protein
VPLPRTTKTSIRPASTVPRPNAEATALLLACLAITGLTNPYGEVASSHARFAAVGVGISLVIFLFAEFRKSWTNLLRADLVAIVALYFFLFLEFLFSQKRLDELIQNIVEIRRGVTVSLWGFAAIGVGRHLLPFTWTRRWRVATVEVRPATMVWLFVGSFCLGFFHMLFAVNFNPVEMVRQFLEPRFTQPWTRGQFGDWQAMLYETGSILFLVPSLAGVILGRRRYYSTFQLTLVALGLLFTLFYGFSTGTRNLIGSYLITFLVSLFYASGAKLTKETIACGLFAAGTLGASAFYGIQFREMGLRGFLRGERNPAAETSLYIDYDLYVVAKLTSIFPEPNHYVGLEAPLWMLVRPIPRVLWPGKPDGANVSADSVLGEEGTTVSCTFVGEAYMAAGLFGVILAGLIVGFAAQWWTFKAYSLTSDFSVLIYGSGFFSVVISMRSMYMLPVAILPTLAIGFFGWWFLRHPMRRLPSKRPQPLTKTAEPRASV